MNIAEVREFIMNSSKESAVYIGCDSQRHRKNGRWYASYARVIAVHKDCKNGCRLFGDTIVMPDYGNLRQRLMTEVQMTIELFDAIYEVLGERRVEIHLDVNPDEDAGSNVVIKEAVGYVRGVTGMDPKVKPEALAATYAADMTVRGRVSVGDRTETKPPRAVA